jgi:tape measure domain-containing protein
VAGDVIGSAVIEIGADASGFDDAVEKQTKAPMGKVGKTLSNALTFPLKAGAAVAGTAIATGLGVALTKGFQRLSALDNAQAKMRGLGHSAEAVDTIMSNALASVKGTAFGLGDAATVAASAVAAGIQPGQALEGVLKSVANSAAAAGTDLNEMGSIFNKVAASNKATNAALSQVAYRGLPIYQALAEQMGVTAEEVTKLASQGKIDFATFEKAMTAAAGTVAKEMGTTFTGALDNFNAALGRLGAVLLGPLFEGMKTLFGPLTAGIDTATEALQPLMEELGGRLAPMFERLGERMGEFFANVDVEGLIDKITGLGDALGPLAGLAVGALGPLLSGLPVVGGLFKGLTGPVGLVIGLLGTVIAKSPELRKSLGSAFDAVKASLKSLKPLFPVVVDAVGTLVDVLGGVLADVISTAVVPLLKSLATDILPPLIPVIADIVRVVGDAAQVLADGLGQALHMLLPPLMNLISQALPVLMQVIEAVIPIVLGLVDALLPLIEAIFPVLLTVIEALLPVIEAVGPLLALTAEAVIPLIEVLGDGLIPIIEALANIVEALFPLIEEIITTVMAAIGAYIEMMLALISGDWESAWTAIKDFFAAIWEGVKGILKAAFDFLNRFFGDWVAAAWAWVKTSGEQIATWGKNTWNAFTDWLGRIGQFFADAWNGLVDTVSNAWNSMTTAIRNGINNTVNWVKGLKDRVLGIFSNAGNWLKNAGKNVITGLWDGLKSAWKSVADWFTDKLNWIKGLWPFSPAKHGPLSGGGNPFYMGENFVGLLADGLNSSAGLIDRAMSGLAGQMRLGNPVKDLSNGLAVPDPRVGRSPLLGTTLTAVGPAASSSIGPIAIQVEVNAPATREDGMRVADEVERVLREVGVAVGSR